MKKFEDYSERDIARIDKALAKKVRDKATISESEKTAFLEKVAARDNKREANREQWREIGRDFATRTGDKVVDRLLDKTIKINNGDQQIEIGGTYTPPPPPANKVPLGVWIAIGLVLLVFIIFLLAKFVFKKA
jgi:sarcosine oxidase delta subunit